MKEDHLIPKKNKNRSQKVDSNEKKVLKKVGNFVLTLLSVAFVIGSAGIPTRAIDTTQAAKDVVASEGGKAALNEALKVGRSKPALSVAAAITCIACIPIAGAAASPGLCIACGILIAKVLG